MNAGRDVERLIAGWFAEEAAAGAPDRVLDAARRSIDHTPQRRLAAAWREPVSLTPFRLAALAAVVVVAVVGGAYLGRATDSPHVGGQPTPTATAAPTVAGVTIESYRAARNAICIRFGATVEPLKPQIDGIHDAETSAEDRAAKIRTLLEIVTQLEAMVIELDALEAPAELAEGHAAYVTRYQDMNLFIREMLTLLNEGDLESAASVDEAINVLNDPLLAFENDNLLDVCP